MANAQQTSQRTRHIDIKLFALIDWVKEDLMILDTIASSDNCSDGMTKANAKILFYRHADTIMGRRTFNRSNLQHIANMPITGLF